MGRTCWHIVFSITNPLPDYIQALLLIPKALIQPEFSPDFDHAYPVLISEPDWCTGAVLSTQKMSTTTVPFR